MKKIALLIVITMMLMNSLAIADIDDEIRFNNIPWGISITEVKSYLGSLWSASNSTDECSIHSWPYNWADDYDHAHTGTGVGINSYHADDNYKVAGYDVEFTFLLAYYDYDDSSYTKSMDASHFCQAIVWFDVEYENIDAAYEDLTNKLTRIYGEPTSVVYDADVDGLEWYGTNNTVVRLERHNDRGWNVKSIFLIYGIKNINAILEKLDTLIEQEQIINYVPVDENDLSGL